MGALDWRGSRAREWECHHNRRRRDFFFHATERRLSVSGRWDDIERFTDVAGPAAIRCCDCAVTFPTFVFTPLFSWQRHLWPHGELLAVVVCRFTPPIQLDTLFLHALDATKMPCQMRCCRQTKRILHDGLPNERRGGAMTHRQRRTCKSRWSLWPPAL